MSQWTENDSQSSTRLYHFHMFYFGAALYLRTLVLDLPAKLFWWKDRKTEIPCLIKKNYQLEKPLVGWAGMNILENEQVLFRCCKPQLFTAEKSKGMALLKKNLSDDDFCLTQKPPLAFVVDEGRCSKSFGFALPSRWRSRDAALSVWVNSGSSRTGCSQWPCHPLALTAPSGEVATRFVFLLLADVSEGERRVGGGGAEEGEGGQYIQCQILPWNTSCSCYEYVSRTFSCCHPVSTLRGMRWWTADGLEGPVCNILHDLWCFLLVKSWHNAPTPLGIRFDLPQHQELLFKTLLEELNRESIQLWNKMQQF